MFWNKKKGEKDDPQQEQTPDSGLVKNNGVNYVMVLAGGYLAYLGWKLLKSWYSGEEGVNPVIAIGFGLVFIAVGLWVIWRQWQAYKKYQAEEATQAVEPEELPEDDEEAASEEETGGAETETEAESTEG